LLNRKEGGSAPSDQSGEEASSDKDPARREKDRHEGDLSSLMSHLFNERMGHSPAAREQALAANVEASFDIDKLQDTVDQLLRQILVSHPDQAGDREVRLVLQDSLLPGTEVRLSRGADGLLSVRLLTGHDHAFQTLVAAQSALKERLTAHEQREVRVEVTQEGQNPDNASDRRSATYTGYHGEDGEAPASE
jgi:type III secretion system needle length determinant